MLAVGCVVRRKIQMKKLLLSCSLLVALSASAQNAVWDNIRDLFNPTNSTLLAANELNTSFYWKRDSDNKLNGGAVQLDWWITDQQGAFFGYEEFSDQSAYWRVGYEVRTVFKNVELTLATGTRQSTEDNFGQVSLFISPMLTYRVINTKNWDIRLSAGADLISGTSKPNPYVGVTLRFLKF